MDDSAKYDGFYILPGDEDGLKLSYFDFKEDLNVISVYNLFGFIVIFNINIYILIIIFIFYNKLIKLL